jgi:hypothetical protein
VILELLAGTLRFAGFDVLTAAPAAPLLISHGPAAAGCAVTARQGAREH